MYDDLVITIAREFGSGGHEIGQLLASTYNLPFYDRELITVAAEKSGISQSVIENYDEMPVGSLLYSLSVSSYMSASNGIVQMPVQNQVFQAQFQAIKEVAKQGSCVIVGRCAEYALKDRPHCLNVFLHSKLENRVQRIMKKQELSRADALSMIEKVDKKRQAYHNFYASNKWGKAASYNLTIDTSLFTPQGVVEIIGKAAEAMTAKKA